MSNNDFVKSFKSVQKGCHETSTKNGFWEGDVNLAEKFALMHSEISEALESLRKDDPPDDKIPEFTGVEAELADVVIRIMDFAEETGSKIAEAIVAKSEFNKTRPYKHGKKF